MIREKLVNKHIHFVGIGGISMSALARLCYSNGAVISGSDRDITAVIKTASIAYTYESGTATMPQDIDYVVYSAAIPSTDTDLTYAREKGIPCIPRAEFLSRVMDCYENTIAVAGSHGKTTVTTMIAEMLSVKNVPFTAHIGGDSVYFGDNLVMHGEKYLVTEACEYDKSFLTLSPKTAIIINTEYDHPDTYKTADEALQTFGEFAQKATHALICPLDQNLKTAILNSKAESIYLIADEQPNYANIPFTTATGTRMNVNVLSYAIHGVCSGKYTFTAYYNGVPVTTITMAKEGLHNVYNSLFALAVCKEYGIDISAYEHMCKTFTGNRRRFELLGRINDVDIISDYAHHPTEVCAAVKTAIDIYDTPPCVVFEPHTFSRTMAYLDDFVYCFLNTATVALLPTYPARETPKDGVDSLGLYIALRHSRKSLLSGYSAAVEYILHLARSKPPCILLLGAGSIGTDLVKCLEKEFD